MEAARTVLDRVGLNAEYIPATSLGVLVQRGEALPAAPST